MATGGSLPPGLPKAAALEACRFATNVKEILLYLLFLSGGAHEVSHPRGLELGYCGRYIVTCSVMMVSSHDA
jgi:hypothetical protein